MSKYDKNSAAAIESRLARQYRRRVSEREWQHTRHAIMQYAAVGGSQKTRLAQRAADALDGQKER